MCVCVCVQGVHSGVTLICASKKCITPSQHQKKNRTIVDQYGQEHGKAIHSLMGNLDVLYNGYSAGKEENRKYPHIYWSTFLKYESGKTKPRVNINASDDKYDK